MQHRLRRFAALWHRQSASHSAHIINEFIEEELLSGDHIWNLGLLMWKLLEDVSLFDRPRGQMVNSMRMSTLRKWFRSWEIYPRS